MIDVFAIIGLNANVTRVFNLTLEKLNKGNSYGCNIGYSLRCLDKQC